MKLRRSAAPDLPELSEPSDYETDNEELSDIIEDSEECSSSEWYTDDGDGGAPRCPSSTPVKRSQEHRNLSCDQPACCCALLLTCKCQAH